MAASSFVTKENVNKVKKTWENLLPYSLISSLARKKPYVLRNEEN